MPATGYARVRRLWCLQRLEAIGERERLPDEIMVAVELDVGDFAPLRAQDVAQMTIGHEQAGPNPRRVQRLVEAGGEVETQRPGWAGGELAREPLVFILIIRLPEERAGLRQYTAEALGVAQASIH